MDFLSPAFLFGLPLVAVPLAIHLLNRRQKKRIGWGAMRFLVQAATRRRRLWRLTDLLLLILRTAVFLFFILALARPLMPMAWLAGSVPREVVIVLDPSLSMTRRVGDRTLFERQREAAIAILDELTGGDSARILSAGEPPEWLVADAVPVTATSRRQLRTKVDELRSTLGASDPLMGVREAVDLEPLKDKARRVIVAISDGQRFGWHLDEPALWSAVQTRVQQSHIPTSVSLRLLDDGGSRPNLSVDKLEAPRTFAAAGQALTLTATVRNQGPEPSSSHLMAWHVNGQPAGVTTVPELATGAATTVSLDQAFPAAGTFDVDCHLESGDGLTGDDEAHLLVDVYDRLPVLLVETSSSSESIENDAPFVLAALGARGGTDGRRAWHSVFDPTVIDAGSLGSTDLSAFRCIILADIPVPPAAVIRDLEAYVRNGGGLWLALGRRTDAASFNEPFHRGGLGLAPLKLGTPIGDPNDRTNFTTVRATSEVHPATALLSDFQRLDLDRARIYRRHQFEAGGGRDVSILLQDQRGDPVVVERRLGRGRVIVQGVPLGVSWSTLPLCQAYVALLHEWLWYLSEPSLPRRNLAVAEAIREPASTNARIAELVLPDDRQVPLSVERSGALAEFRYSATRLPGGYTINFRGNMEKTGPARFQVRRNPLESNLAPMTDQDRQQLAATPGFLVGGGLEAGKPGDTDRLPRNPLDRWFLIALAAVLLGEMLVAAWTTHRRGRRLPALSMPG